MSCKGLIGTYHTFEIAKLDSFYCEALEGMITQEDMLNSALSSNEDIAEMIRRGVINVSFSFSSRDFCDGYVLYIYTVRVELLKNLNFIGISFPKCQAYLNRLASDAYTTLIDYVVNLYNSHHKKTFE